MRNRNARHVRDLNKQCAPSRLKLPPYNVNQLLVDMEFLLVALGHESVPGVGIPVDDAQVMLEVALFLGHVGDGQDRFVARLADRPYGVANVVFVLHEVVLQPHLTRTLTEYAPSGNTDKTQHRLTSMILEGLVMTQAMSLFSGFGWASKVIVTLTSSPAYIFTTKVFIFN